MNKSKKAAIKHKKVKTKKSVKKKVVVQRAGKDRSQNPGIFE